MSDLKMAGLGLLLFVGASWAFLVTLVAVTIVQRRRKRRPVLLLPCSCSSPRGALYLTSRGPRRSRSRRTRSVHCASPTGAVTA